MPHRNRKLERLEMEREEIKKILKKRFYSKAMGGTFVLVTHYEDATKAILTYIDEYYVEKGELQALITQSNKEAVEGFADYVSHFDPSVSKDYLVHKYLSQSNPSEKGIK